MRKYVLKIPKDEHGQPKQLFKINFENNVPKAIDQLSGIWSGILADGIVTEAEAKFFTEYVRKFAAYEPVDRLLVFLRVLSAFLPMASATTKNGKNLDMLWRLCAVMQNNAAQARPILRRFLLIRRFPIRLFFQVTVS